MFPRLESARLTVPFARNGEVGVTLRETDVGRLFVLSFSVGRDGTCVGKEKESVER